MSMHKRRLDRGSVLFVLLAQRTIPRGEVLLYAFGGTRPDVAGKTCVATTFVSKERNGWRAQSSSSLGCRADFPQPEEPVLAYTIGGNIVIWPRCSA